MAAAPYDGRGASSAREEVMTSAGEKSERNEQEVAHDEQQRGERQSAHGEIDVAGQQHQHGGQLEQPSAVWPRELTRHEKRYRL